VYSVEQSVSVLLILFKWLISIMLQRIYGGISKKKKYCLYHVNT